MKFHGLETVAFRLKTIPSGIFGRSYFPSMIKIFFQVPNFHKLDWRKYFHSYPHAGIFLARQSIENISVSHWRCPGSGIFRRNPLLTLRPKFSRRIKSSPYGPFPSAGYWKRPIPPGAKYPERPMGRRNIFNALPGQKNSRMRKTMEIFSPVQLMEVWNLKENFYH